MDHTLALLDDAFAWTAGRIAAVPPHHLDAPTPCTLWNLQELLDHTVASLTMLTEAVEAPEGEQSQSRPVVQPLGTTRWDHAIAELAARSHSAWAVAGVTSRSFDLPTAPWPRL